MQFPSVLYGPYRDVKPRTRKVIAQLKHGAEWEHAMCADGLTDSRTVAGLFLLNGPSPLVGGSAHFQCYLPLREVEAAVTQDKLPPDISEPIFRTSLQTAWGTLGLLALTNVMWVYPRERYVPLLRAVVRYWDAFEAEGERYSVGQPVGVRLWSIASNLKFVLANMGVSNAALNEPSPSAGLVEMMRRVADPH